MAKVKLKVERAGHINPHTMKVGFIPRVLTSGTAGFEEIVEEACRNTTLHRAEARAAFEVCMDKVAEMLMQGYIIDLGPVGRLYPSCSGRWVERAEDMRLEGVVPTINYRPTKAMGAAMRGAALQWAKKSAAKEDENFAPGVAGNS